jgi:hypothetical protein
VAAAVVSEAIAAPTSTPWRQSRASNTSGASEGATATEDDGADGHALRRIHPSAKSSGIAWRTP